MIIIIVVIIITREDLIRFCWREFIIIIIVVIIPRLIFLNTSATVVISFIFVSTDRCNISRSNCFNSNLRSFTKSCFHCCSIINFIICFALRVSIFTHMEVVTTCVNFITYKSYSSFIIYNTISDDNVRICPVFHSVNFFHINSCIRVDIKSFYNNFFRRNISIWSKIIFWSIWNFAQVINYKFCTTSNNFQTFICGNFSDICIA